MHDDIEVTRRAAVLARAALALIRIFWPSVTPAGIRTCMVCRLWVRPLPWQTSHGLSTIRPRPRHSRQGSVTWKTPPEVDCCMPEPWQVGQTRGIVPALAPVPRQAGQASSLVIWTPTVVPSTAWRNRSSPPFDVGVRRGPRVCDGRRPRRPARNRLPSRSPSPASPMVRKTSSPDAPPPGAPRRGGTGSRIRTDCVARRTHAVCPDRSARQPEASLKRCSADLSPGCWSGWFSRAIFRNA